MKRMETKIAVTVVIVGIVGTIICGIYNALSSGSKIFTSEAISGGILMALVYLSFIWVITRRHQALAGLGVTLLWLFPISLGIDKESIGTIGTRGGFRWYNAIFSVYVISTILIALYHGRKLREEDNQKDNKEAR